MLVACWAALLASLTGCLAGQKEYHGWQMTGDVQCGLCRLEPFCFDDTTNQFFGNQSDGLDANQCVNLGGDWFDHGYPVIDRDGVPRVFYCAGGTLTAGTDPNRTALTLRAPSQAPSVCFFERSAWNSAYRQLFGGAT